MQDGSWNQPLPFSLLLKSSAAAGGTVERDGGVSSEASSDGELYLDSATELDSGDGDFADLTAFLSADEINRSLDLAREAFDDTTDDLGDCKGAATQEQVLQPSPLVPVKTQGSENLQNKSNHADDTVKFSCSQNTSNLRRKAAQVFGEAPPPTENMVCHKPVRPIYKQDKPRLIHAGLELNDRVASATEFCSRAATFIEELSSIFRGSAHVEQQVEEDSSSPDSGYLSPRSQRPAPQGSASASSQQEQVDPGPQPGPPPVTAAVAATCQNSGGAATAGALSPPQFLQKLKSQEVAEGSPIRLECRVTGNPQPLVR